MNTILHEIISITTKEHRLLFESGSPSKMAEIGVEEGKESDLKLPDVLKFLAQKMTEANDKVKILRNLEDQSVKFKDMTVRVMDELNEEYQEWLTLVLDNGAEFVKENAVSKDAVKFGMQLAEKIQSLIEKI